jgi:regulator of sigma E protease
LSIIVAILVFGLIVLIHEFGHFLFAKLNGIGVVEFSVGMGPRLLHFEKGETTYSIKVLPIGGSCMMLGEDEENPDDKAFQNKSILARFSVLAAGPVFNFILAFVLAVILVGMGGYNVTSITEVGENSPAYEAGIRPGDNLLKINGKDVTLFQDYTLYKITKPNEMMNSVEFSRTNPSTGISEKITASVTPKYSEEDKQYLIGIKIKPQNTKASSLGALVKYGYKEMVCDVNMTVKSLGMLLSGKASVKDLSGPVGIVVLIDDSVKSGLSVSIAEAIMNVFSMCILLSANLGVMNLLPIPALDGGRILFLIIEAIRGKRIDPQKEGIVNIVGFAALMVLMIFVVFNDISRFM